MKDDGEETKEEGTEIDEATGLPVEITNFIGLKLRLIPAGSFEMGALPIADVAAEDDEKPRHPVKITKPFYIGVYEVTQGQWQSVMGTSIYQLRDKADRNGGTPVVRS